MWGYNIRVMPFSLNAIGNVLLFLTFFVLPFYVAYLIARAAANRGRSFWTWLAAGLFFLPATVPGYLAFGRKPVSP